MLRNLSPRLRAVFQALFVTFLWSTSWVLVKIGLKGIPALPFAGLRYMLAFVVLLPFAIRGGRLAGLHRLSGATWTRLAVLGLLFYAVTQGTVYWALSYLPAMTVSLLLNATTLVVALLGILLLREVPSPIQWAGVVLFLGGALAYFHPLDVPPAQAAGFILAAVCVLSNALSSILGRHVNRDPSLDPMTVTVVSMGIGALALLLGGVLVQGLPQLSLLNWGIIAWLAMVNSAFAFTLWNHTLRTISAAESSIINNTMLIQIAVLAWLFLGEELTGRQVLGLGLAAAGVLVVQLRWRPRPGRSAGDGQVGA